MMDREALNILEKVIYTAGIVTAFWKFVDSLFGFLHKRQRGFLVDLIKEELSVELLSLKNDITEMKKQRELDNKTQFEQYRNILNELKK